MSTLDTMSIAEVLYEGTKQPGWPKWQVALPAVRDRYERAAEVIFLRAYNQGYGDGKAANPPPKARALGMQLVKERAAWAAKWAALVTASRAYMAAQSADNVTVRHEARDALLTALREPL